MSKKRIIRVRNGFSDRNMLDPISKEIQCFDFSPATRTTLFNSLKNNVEIQIESQRLNRDGLAQCIVESLFNDIYNPYEDNYDVVLNDILSIIENGKYHEVLTIIEYICNLVFESESHYSSRHGNDWYYSQYYINIHEQLNKTFENEFIGYRFIENKIVPITNNAEIDSIVNSLKTPFEKVNESILKAISFISETGNKDYKNSIKESITALEELVNILNKSSGLVLSNAIEQLTNKYLIDENLKESIKRLYKYASNTNGIRHGNNKKNDDISFDEAKYILLICSASINYFCSLKNKKE